MFPISILPSLAVIKIKEKGGVHAQVARKRFIVDLKFENNTLKLKRYIGIVVTMI